jgi:hypothetical protein
MLVLEEKLADGNAPTSSCRKGNTNTQRINNITAICC